jgi:hypothetical protein
MRSTRLVSPIALLASACAVGTPARSIVGLHPQSLDTDLPSREDALRRWQLRPDDPWSGYAKYTLLSALDQEPRHVELPDVSSLDDVQRARRAGALVAAAGLPSETMWVVDMRGAASVAFGVAMSHAAGVSLVPTFNNWPARGEVVPAEETLAAMVTMAPQSPEDASSQPVFLLDAWRLALRFEEPDDDAYDNRYLLSPADVPTAAILQGRGIRHVVYVVASLSDSRAEEDDLHAAFAAYRAAGMSVTMIDLDVLLSPIEAAGWDDLRTRYDLAVGNRVTVLDDPGFFTRARGGFGGVHAQPCPIRWTGQWTLHGAGG